MSKGRKSLANLQRTLKGRTGVCLPFVFFRLGER